MGAWTMLRWGWMGMTLSLFLGTAAAQTSGAAPTASDSAAKAAPASPVVKKAKKTERTEEQRQFEQSIQAMRAESDKLNAKSIQDARTIETERLEKEKAGKTLRVGPAEGKQKAME